MNAKIITLLLLPLTASAQGFAGLGTGSGAFETPERPAIFDFPTDYGPHTDFRIEWWYLTANLQAEDGTPYGLQWTLFRSALAPVEGESWSSPQFWMGHAAVTTPDAHFVTERLARGGIGQAGVNADPFEAWIDDWQLVGTDFDTLEMTASGPDFAYDMGLTAQGPLVFHGDAGYSVKSEQGQASYYYSQPFYDISGRLTLPDGEVEVTGQAWLDREWSSQPLSDNQTGWDWFSLSLDTGKLMGFRLRQTDGSYYTSATWIALDGTATAYGDGAFVAEPVATTDVNGREIPTMWTVRLDAQGVDVDVYALNPQAWMDTSIPYWEGPIIVEGSHTGRGYLEMTGYD
ncbi:lipocalin-like domain-containing protein [Octadecabacter sp. 1_MG-2023]|uniref:lipocalin-like domain-containing protein n=1 Tax=unclassified Octadecabacter TaxID=196158 RepID=UPI001C0A5577|nr:MULTISPECIES: lipocalin-like domain-containing protein [unclassified Octadecabacter]MBU2992441.1 iron ABC transporter permease [Octadecabacter sp. B2R22]MDO6734802.1 lipocalin-like domain-containing protein [Octadecabacter sp. 1_MG-2023]